MPRRLPPPVLALAVAAQDRSTVEIAPGVRMPRVSLGTCCGSDPSVGVPAWFAAGGIGIDTAWDYHDQPAIAQEIAASGKSRADYFLTTKIPAGMGAYAGNATDCSATNLTDVALWYVRDNLRQLGVDHVDLTLLHAPCSFARPPVPDPAAADNALWEGLQQARALGLTKAIGVSNYNASQLAALAGAAPAINQCQMSVAPDGNHSEGWPLPPIAHDDATIQYCLDHNVTYEAWRVLGGCPFTDARVTAVAAAHGVTAAQVCLRWVLQRGAVVAAGTGADAARAGEYSKENLGALGFSLTPAEMVTLGAISPP